TVDGFGPLERIVSLQPDLVFINSFGLDPRAEQLRAAGVQVFDVGELRGIRTLLPLAETVGELLDAPERGRAFAEGLQRRVTRVAVSLGQRPRRRSLYLSVIGGQLQGGAAGTSYHDVLTHAGLLDVASAAGYRGWMQYSAEQVAALNPDLIVTKESLRSAV